MDDPLVKLRSARRADQLLAAAAFAISLAISLPLLPHTVTFEDSAEFVTATATMGILHPSGYPLYLLLAKLFTWLPFGTLPWRVALFSGFCAAAAVALVALIILETARAAGVRVDWRVRPFAGLAALQLAVGGIWWSQAVYAKNYSLHALLILAVVWCLVRTAQEPAGRVRWTCAAAFCLGLAAANHVSLTLAVAPLLIAALFVARPDLRRPSRLWLWLALAGLAGLLPYLYLPLRTAAKPAFAMGAVSSWGDLVYYVTRARYSDLGWGEIGSKWPLLRDLSLQVFRGVGLIATVSAAAGIAVLWRRRRRRIIRVTLWAVAGLLAAIPVVVLLRDLAWSPAAVYFCRIYGLTCLAGLAVLAGLAYVRLAAGLASKKRPVLLAVAAAVLALSVVAGWSGDRAYAAAFAAPYPEVQIRQLLGSLPPEAVLVVKDEEQTNDTELFTIAYLQAVENFRRDVSIVHDSQVNFFYLPSLPPFYGSLDLGQQRQALLWATLRVPQWSGRPVYATFPSELAEGCPLRPTGGCWTSRSNGYAYEVRAAADPRVNLAAVRPEPPDLASAGQSFALDQFLAHVSYVYASWQAESGDDAGAAATALRAAALDPIVSGSDRMSLSAHLRSVRSNAEHPAPASSGTE